MKMRFYISMVLMAATGAACSGEVASLVPEVSDEMIRFGMPAMEVELQETKSTLVEENFPEGGVFGVLGYCLAQMGPDNATLSITSGSVDWDTKKVLCPPHLFYNTPVTYANGICEYEGEPVPWYEPADYQYTFYAFYPYGDTYMNTRYFIETSSKDQLGAPSVKFSLPFAGTSKEDILDDALVPDAMVAMAEDVTRGMDGMVELRFYHLLTGLNFQVNNYNEDPDDAESGENLTIHSLKLKGTFYKSVKMDFDKGWEFPNETFSGTYVLVNEDIEIPHHTSVEQIGGKTLLLVSGQNKEGGTTGYLGPDVGVEIEYTFVEQGENGELVRKKQFIERPDNFLPVGGTVYTAQLNFIGEAFVLNIIVDNDSKWEDGGDSNITFK